MPRMIVLLSPSFPARNALFTFMGLAMRKTLERAVAFQDREADGSLSVGQDFGGQWRRHIIGKVKIWKRAATTPQMEL